MNRDTLERTINQQIAEARAHQRALAVDERAEIRRRWLAGEDAGDLAREFNIDVKRVRKVALRREGECPPRLQADGDQVEV